MEVYTNDLHDALMSKQGVLAVLEVKFERNTRVYIDVTTIAKHFYRATQLC